MEGAEVKTTIVQSPARWEKKEGCSLGGHGSAERLLGGIHHVEEAVLVAFALIHLQDGR